MLDLESPEVQFALQAVDQACYLVRQVQAEMVEPALTKDDRSPVTVADFAAQALIAQRLERAFPDASLVAEETSQALQAPAGHDTLLRVSQYVQRFVPEAAPQQVCDWIDRGVGQPEGRFWVLDPIDGTKGFLRRGQYAVALALLEQGRLLLGVLGCPDLKAGCTPDESGTGSLVAAQCGLGTWYTALGGQARPRAFEPADFTRLSVSERSSPIQARLLRSYEAAHTNAGVIDCLVERLDIQAEPARLDSQAKYAVLAAGCGEALLRLPPDDNLGYREKIWDQAAGALVVEEAGGRITDIHGRALDFSAGRTLQHNRGILASNGHLHAALLDGLAALGI
jgi:3'(2'), 5'-bisphosphate nucleotidase